MHNNQQLDSAKATEKVALKTFDGIPRMPALFGRQPGPRQRPDRNEGYPAKGASTLASWVVARADANALKTLLPVGFTLAEPLLIVEAVSLSNLPWLAGRGYEMLMVSVPVTYKNGDLEQQGRLELVTWEDCPDAILSGREELGWNKVYADTMKRHSGNDGKSVRYIASWGGTRFFDMEITLKCLPGIPGSWRKGPLMHYRVLPRTGAWGELEVEQVTAAPAMVPLTSMRSLKGGIGCFRFYPATFEQLPTLAHVVNRLAAIQLVEVVDAGQAQVAAWTRLHDMQVLSSTSPIPFVANRPIESDDETFDQEVPS